jgi:hypothetical protein
VSVFHVVRPWPENDSRPRLSQLRTIRASGSSAPVGRRGTFFHTDPTTAAVGSNLGSRPTRAISQYHELPLGHRRAVARTSLEQAVADHRRPTADVRAGAGLTMKRVRRPPQKPKRPTREQLQRRSARFPTQTDNATPGPANSTRPQPPERPAAPAENFGAQVLAPAPPDGTMQAPVGALPLSPDARPAESAHRERANDSWFRRHITPLLSIWKTANIPR